MMEAAGGVPREFRMTGSGFKQQEDVSCLLLDGVSDKRGLVLRELRMSRSGRKQHEGLSCMDVLVPIISD